MTAPPLAQSAAHLLAEAGVNRPATLATLTLLAPEVADWLTPPNVCAILGSGGEPSMAQTKRLRTVETDPSPDPWRTLALAVILQAIKDTQGPKLSHRYKAQTWLHSPACAELCVALDMDHQTLLRRVAAYVKPRRRRVA